MRYQIILYALIILVAGCAQNDEVSELAPKEVTITASFADSQTRTILPDSGTSVYWEKGDEIKIFFETTGSKFTSTLSESAAVSEFTGSLPVVFGSTEGASAEMTLLAVYPYSSDATSDGTSITTTLPDEQDARDGSFAKNLNLSMAQSNSTSMGFYNVCSGVCFRLTSGDIRQISLKSNNGEALSGTVRLAFENGVPAVQDITEAKDSVTLFPPDGSTFSTGVWYYIVTLPGTLSGGFKMTFKTEDKYAMLLTSSSTQLRRGVFGRISDIDAGLTWRNMSGSSSGDNIVFEDINVKNACVAKYDTNRDGEISYEEAAAVTDLSGLFDSCKTITSFDELQYFTKVTELPKNLFSGCSSLTSVILPSSLEAIGASCFSACLKLDNLDIPRTVKTIGEYCFNACAALTSLELSGSISSIGQYCFNGCQSLSNLKIAGSVTKLPAYFIKDCKSLTSFTIPESVKSLDRYCFSGCTGLTSIEIPSSVKSLSNYCFSDCTGLTSIEIPSSVTSLGGACFKDCTGLTSIDVPSSVTSLGDWCFSGCTGLMSVEIHSQVTALGKSCFYSCRGLTSIEIPSSVTSLGINCFYGCTGLTSIEIPLSVTSLGDYCFMNCSGLTSIGIPSSLTSLGEACFSGCSGLTSIEIPSSVTSLEGGCFKGCSGLTSIEIPSSVILLGGGCFSGCSGLTSIKIPSSVASLGNYCFNGCTGLTSVEIPSSVASLGNHCFYGCTGLTSVEIPPSVTSLGNGCFWKCTGLTSIEIPPSVTSLGDDCFRACTNLSEMHCLAVSVPTLGNNAFYLTKASSEGHLYVPEESVEQYANDSGWNVWKNIQKLE